MFFEGAPIHDVVIEELTFNCSGDGVEAMGEFHNITLRDNVFIVGQNGITTRGPSSEWQINENAIQAGWDGIRISGVRSFKITKNDISAKNGISLLTTSEMQVKSNTIQSQNLGILLGQEAWKNTAQANKISGVSLAGIALEPNERDNRVLANKVTCAQGTNCVAVSVPADLARGNKISGNSRK
ncbi:MAG: hypothetical protein A2136_00995 [Chloroflexi bacterium RBG_16_54_11]|nr:MAG: hypothetical protein A2136_00995 [Chloroflexi bacterium RBG_16_54_11]